MLGGKRMKQIQWAGPHFITLLILVTRRSQSCFSEEVPSGMLVSSILREFVGSCTKEEG